MSNRGRGHGQGRGGQGGRDDGPGQGRGGRGRGNNDRGGGGGRGQGRGDGRGGGRGQGARGDRGGGQGQGARQDQRGGQSQRGGYQQQAPSSQMQGQFGPPVGQPPQHAAPQGAWGRPQQPPAQQPQPAAQQQPQAQQQQQQQQPPRQQPQQQPPRQQPQQQPLRQQQQQQPPKQQQQKQLDVAMASTSLADAGDSLAYKSKMQVAKGGTKGRRVEVFTNHFPLRCEKLGIVHQHDVDIQPDRPKKALRAAMEKVREQHYPNIHPAYDGSKGLYSARKLPLGAANLLEATVMVRLEDREREYRVKIKKVQEIDMSAIAHFYSTCRRQVVDAPQIALQVIDVVLRHTQALNRIVVGSSLFSVPRRIVDLGGGMHLYRGMYQSAVLGWKPFLNIDVANKAFPSESSVLDLIRVFDQNANYNQQLDRRTVEKLSRHVKGLRVRYDLPNQPSARRIYRVNSVDDLTADGYSFAKDDGTRITVYDYYAREKMYRLKHPKMPLLWVGSMQGPRRIYLPCELCTVLPGQPVARRCDANQTRAMIKECATNTDVRRDGIMENLRDAQFPGDPVIAEFGLSVGEAMERIDARILQPPRLQYRTGNANVSKGVWMAKEFIVGARATGGWTILNLDRYVRDLDIRNLVDLVQRNARGFGMELGAFTSIVDSANAFKQLRFGHELRELSDIFKEVCKRKLDLVFVILSRTDHIYDYVKNAAEIAAGCLTQCMKSDTVQRRMNDMTMKNILMKVNAKLNGSNHSLVSVPSVMMKSYVMLMGADVTHPAPDVVDGFSVAAVTASHCPNAFRYNLCWRLQPPGREIIDDMADITRSQLMQFYKRNGNRKPEKIIMYRDGVSTGQFDQVLSAELTAIRKACASLEKSYEPKITFIVVQKRHHTRFFPIGNISEDRNKNVPAGTIVDRDITHPTRQDFYLVSHASIQGVAKPTKYVTLWDDNDMGDDEVEELTYYLCHMFTRCTRSVSYPAPTYYAHLAAARGKSYCDAINLRTADLRSAQDSLKIQATISDNVPMFFV